MKKSINFLFFGIAIAMILNVVWSFFSHGWLATHDYYYLAGAALVLLGGLLPFMIKINLVIFLLLISLVEVGARLFVASQAEEIVETKVSEPEGTPLRIQDHTLGYRPPANSSSVHSKYVAGDEIFNANYTVDEYGRREVVQAPTGCRDEHILFFGGSNAFGFGVENSETLPAQVAMRTPRYKVYNYAYNGYGPQHMLARLAETELENEVDINSGQAIYVFIDDHVKRAINTMQTRWVHRSPDYEIIETGDLVRNGNFNTAHPIKYRLYHDFLLNSVALKLLGVDIPMKIRSEHVKLTAKIIEVASNIYRKKFNNGHFTVLLLPAPRSSIGDGLVAELEKLHIPVLNYQGKIANDSLGDYKIDEKYEPHFNARAHKAISEWLTHDLKLNEPCMADSSVR